MHVLNPSGSVSVTAAQVSAWLAQPPIVLPMHARAKVAQVAGAFAGIISVRDPQPSSLIVRGAMVSDREQPTQGWIVVPVAQAPSHEAGGSNGVEGVVAFVDAHFAALAVIDAGSA